MVGRDSRDCDRRCVIPLPAKVWGPAGARATACSPQGWEPGPGCPEGGVGAPRVMSHAHAASLCGETAGPSPGRLTEPQSQGRYVDTSTPCALIPPVQTAPSSIVCPSEPLPRFSAWQRVSHRAGGQRAALLSPRGPQHRHPNPYLPPTASRMHPRGLWPRWQPPIKKAPDLRALRVSANTEPFPKYTETEPRL